MYGKNIYKTPLNIYRFLRLHTLTALGYAVVVVDSRGSAHRGLQFESHIKHRLVSILSLFLVYSFISGDRERYKTIILIFSGAGLAVRFWEKHGHAGRFTSYTIQ